MKRKPLYQLGIFSFIALVVIGCETPPAKNAFDVATDKMPKSKYHHSVAGNAVEIYRTDSDQNKPFITIGGSEVVNPIGIAGPLPVQFFAGDGGYAVGSLENDLKGTNFGYAVAILENDQIYEVGEDPALLAVGAPEAGNGAGAVYVFKIGSKGLWIELKVTQETYNFGRPIINKTGLGSKIRFNDGFLQIGFYENEGAISIPINFLID